ncbi:sensor histidine kinase [Agromyces seonyuensis]|uniref:histidine kinase n=1 Tax=Agromyces seonyuensis TaxID=2662446 RepID=A0A6I4NW71_9MICO|nr:histidine kinase [Agromyces seonyuensis]MWB98523.1 histidine kinase [Agromyces seonyuensis]
MTSGTASRRDDRMTPFWLRRAGLFDLIAQVLVWLVVAVGLSVPFFEGEGGLGSVSTILLSGAGFALAYRSPAAGATLIGVAPIVAAMFGVDPIYLWNIAVFAVFSLAFRALPGLVTGALIGGAAYFSELMFSGWHPEDLAAAVAGIAVFAAGAAGGGLRAQLHYWAELRGRTNDALAARDVEVHRRIAEERLRIARDLHDVVGHEIAVVSMQLGAAEVSLPAGADASRSAIGAARSGVQRVLAETQSILRVLRRGDGEQTESLPPGYDRIQDLVASFAVIGLDVAAAIDPIPAALEPGVDAAAFRIVQEALTNAQRHGDGAAELRVEAAGGRIIITVENTASSATSSRGTGYGLIGMRERAEATGGKLATDRVGDRFRVVVELGTTERGSA